MQPSRREFLERSLGSSALVVAGVSAPVFLARSASALAVQPTSAANRVLVVVQLTGGNDGLNSVIPYRDDAYLKNRPSLKVPEDRRIKLDDRVALHRSLRELNELLDKGQLAIVQSVGYPNPSRSHFQSMATWQTGRAEAGRQSPGWIAQSLDNRPPSGDGPSAMHVGDAEFPQALLGGRQQPPSIAGTEQIQRRLGVSEATAAARQRDLLNRLAQQEVDQADPLLQFVRRAMVSAYATSDRLQDALARAGKSSDYPEDYGLAKRLKAVAGLIKAGLRTTVYYVELDGFDTHASQFYTHASLLRELGISLRAFYRDLTAAGMSQSVLTLVFSEFGRRLAENASGGTDHGTAAPVFLAGPAVKAGLHGPYPNLNDLVDGDPKHSIDFRSVYAAILDRWLGIPSARVLGAAYPPVSPFNTEK